MTRRSQFLSSLLRWRLRSEVSHLVRLETRALEVRIDELESQIQASFLALEDELARARRTGAPMKPGAVQ